MGIVFFGFARKRIMKNSQSLTWKNLQQEKRIPKANQYIWLDAFLNLIRQLEIPFIGNTRALALN